MGSDPDVLANALAELVRQSRIQLYSQTELAKRVGVSRSTIQTIEKGGNVESRSLFACLAFLKIDYLLVEEIKLHLEKVAPEKKKQRKIKITRGLDNNF